MNIFLALVIGEKRSNMHGMQAAAQNVKVVDRSVNL